MWRFGGNRYLIPFNGGIATPVCALARNDSVYLVRTFKQQFICVPGNFSDRKDDYSQPASSDSDLR